MADAFSVREIGQDIAISQGFERIWTADNIAIVVLMICLLMACVMITLQRRDIKIIVQESRNDRNLMFDKFIGVMRESTESNNKLVNSINILNERIGHG